MAAALSRCGCQDSYEAAAFTSFQLLLGHPEEFRVAAAAGVPDLDLAGLQRPQPAEEGQQGRLPRPAGAVDSQHWNSIGHL